MILAVVLKIWNRQPERDVQQSTDIGSGEDGGTERHRRRS